MTSHSSSRRAYRALLRLAPNHLRETHGLAMEQLDHFLLHPGGRKVLEGIEGRFGLTPEKAALSWGVLRDYGNLSSATVLVLLRRFAETARPAPGDWGLMTAVGPGFAAEMLLLKW